jgi:hypothetical protein
MRTSIALFATLPGNHPIGTTDHRLPHFIGFHRVIHRNLSSVCAEVDFPPTLSRSLLRLEAEEPYNFKELSHSPQSE